ncbi:MAG: alpha-amylase, partial [Nitrospirae bacterium]
KRVFIIGLLTDFIESSSDAWLLCCREVSKYYNSIIRIYNPLYLLERHVPAYIATLIGDFFLRMLSLLGKRTAEMHLLLSKGDEEDGFTLEPSTKEYRSLLLRMMLNHAEDVFSLLSHNIDRLHISIRDDAISLLALRDEIKACYRPIENIEFMKMRIHGDYHLGQVLFTGDDFVIIDFEGEPIKPLSLRRMKYSPFVDVAGMLRSLHYAAYTVLYSKREYRGLEAAAERWYDYACSLFLKSYIKTMSDSACIPENRDDMSHLLKIFLLDKAVYEIGYELNNRPDWVLIPIKGVLRIIQEFKGS